MSKMGLKLKSNLSAPQNSDLMVNNEEMVRSSIEENEMLRREIEYYINHIGHLPCIEVAAIQFLDYLLLSDENAWENFASCVGLNSIEDITVVKNMCQLEGTSKIMLKIVQYYNKKYNEDLKWKIILESLLTLKRYDILLQLVEKKSLYSIKNKQDKSLTSCDLINQQRFHRHPVETEDRDISFKEVNTEVDHLEDRRLQLSNAQQLSNENNKYINEVITGQKSSQDFKQDNCHDNLSTLPFHSTSEQENENLLLTPRFFSMHSDKLNYVHHENTKEFVRSHIFVNENNNISEIQSFSNIPMNNSINSYHLPKNYIKVFLTYSSDAKEVGREIKKKMEDCEFKVITVNKLLKATADINCYEAIHEAVKKVDFVLVVLSKKYIRDINKPDPETENAVRIRLVYDIYRNRYVNNGCYNTDIRVLRLPAVSFSDTKELVSCLQNTFIYPREFKKLTENLQFAFNEKENQGSETN